MVDDARSAYRMVQVHQQIENEMDDLPARRGSVAGEKIGDQQTYGDGHRAENEDEREKKEKAGQTDSRGTRGIAQAVRWFVLRRIAVTMWNEGACSRRRF